MALTFSTQAVIAFKNLSGKSNTDVTKGVNNEAEGIFFNVDSTSIWVDVISPTPSVAVSNGVAVSVTADLILDNTSNGYGYFAQWPSIAPSGTDPLTLSSYSYGTGLLVGILPGDRVRNSIPPSYGYLYEAKPYTVDPSLIPPGDPRNWIYQYNSGVFYQQDIIGSLPGSIQLYFYSGDTLSDQQSSSIVNSNNIRVYTTGTNSYIGTATPSILTYSINDLYLVDFQYTNTGTSSLNIGGLGTYEIIKFDQSGPVGLSAGDIHTSQTSYLTWDGANFQLFYSNPISSSPNAYTNLSPVPTTIGGISAGTTFSEFTMKQMWDLLLYPYQSPSFTSFNFNHGGITKEVGDDLYGGNYTFNWGTTFPANVNTDSINIIDNTTSTNLILGTSNDGIALLGIATVSTSVPTTHQWYISGLSTNSVVFSSSVTIGWYWRRYHGTQISTSLSDVQIMALNGSGSGLLTTTRVGTFAFTTSDYKYFSWPVSFGTPLLFRDSSTNLAVAMAGIAEGYTDVVGGYYAQTVSVTNSFGETTNYYVFRSKNILGGSINIVVT